MSGDPEDPKSSRGVRWLARYKNLGEFIFAAVLTFYGVLGYYVIREQLDIMFDQTAVMQQQLIDSRRESREQNAVTASTLAALQEQAAAMTNSIGPATTSAAAAAKLSAEGTVKIAEANTRQVAIADKQAGALSSQAESNKAIADATKQSVETSGRLAAAAAATAESQKRSESIEYGAVVRFSSLMVLQGSNRAGSLYEGGEATEFFFTVINTGRTLAEDARIQSISITRRGTVWTADASNYQNIGAGQTKTLFASVGPFPVTALPKYTPIDIGDITVTLVYKNAFGEMHATRGCYRSRTSGMRDEFVTCGGHNDPTTLKQRTN